VGVLTSISATTGMADGRSRSTLATRSIPAPTSIRQQFRLTVNTFSGQAPEASPTSHWRNGCRRRNSWRNCKARATV